MTEPRRQSSVEREGERVRRWRLRTDGQRSPTVNLQETVSLSRKLAELRDALRRAR